MKKIVFVLAGLFLMLCIGLSVLFIVVGKKYDSDSKRFADRVIPLIFADWNIEALQRNTCYGFNETFKKEPVQQTFDMLSKQFGAFEKYNSLIGESTFHLNFFTKQGLSITASYKSKIKYQKGEPTINLQLILQNNEWKIYNFAISPY